VANDQIDIQELAEILDANRTTYRQPHEDDRRSLSEL
jgi:hypothetical protein